MKLAVASMPVLAANVALSVCIPCKADRSVVPAGVLLSLNDNNHSLLYFGAVFSHNINT